MAKPHKKSKTGKRILQIIAGGVIVLILLIVLLVPMFVSGSRCRQIILAKINSSTGGKADIARISMGWLKGIRITGISFRDNAGRVAADVKEFSTKPHYAAILTGSLSFGETVIDQPKIVLNIEPQAGKDNTAGRPSTGGEATLPIKKINLIVKNGSLKVNSGSAGVVAISDINSRIDLRPPGEKTGFDVNMTVGGSGRESKIHAAGEIRPPSGAGWGLKGTTGNLNIEVNDLDIGSLAPLLAMAGVDIQAKGVVSADIKAAIKDGQLENIIGTVKGRNIEVGGPQLKGDRLKTDVLDVNMNLQARKGLINIEKLAVHSDWMDANAAGVVPVSSQSLADFAKPDSELNLKGDFKCNLAAVLSQMPHTLGLKGDMTITAGQLSGSIDTLTGNGQKSIAAQANLAGLAGIVSGKPVSLSGPLIANVEVTSDKTGLNFNRLDITGPFASIKGSGTTESFRYNADVDLGKLQTQLGQFVSIGTYSLAGEISAEGTIAGDKNKITAAGATTCKNLRINSAKGATISEPAARIDYSVVVEPPKDILNVDSLKIDASFGQLSTKGAVVTLSEKAAKPMTLPVSARIDLAKLQPYLAVFTSFPGDNQLAGAAESELVFTAGQGRYHIKTDSTKVTNLRLIPAGQAPFEQSQINLVLDVEFDTATKGIVVRKLELISPQIKIKGSLEQSSNAGQTRMQGQFDLDYDWSAVSSMASAFMPAGVRLEGKRKDRISFASSYPSAQPDKMLANLNSQAKIGFDSGEYMGLNFGPTEVDISIRNGLLTIVPFSTAVNNGRFSFAAEADFNRKPTLLRTAGPIQMIKDVQINDAMAKKLLQNVNPVFANAVNINGVANFQCETLAIPLAGAAQNDIEVAGTVSLQQVRLQSSGLLSQILSAVGSNFTGQVINVHPTRFVLQKGYLRYDNMQMDVGNSPLIFSGVIGLDKSLDMMVTLPYTVEGKAIRVGRESDAPLVSVPLKGTVDKPKLDLGRLLEDQLKKQLQQQLMKGLFNK